MQTLICPKCGGIKIATFALQAAVKGGGAPSQLECKSCGFVSFTFPEIDPKKIEMFREQLKV